MPDLVIDERRRSVYLNDQEVQLTPQEYRILHRLARTVGQVASKSELMAALWSTGEAAQNEPSHFDPAAVDLVIFRLRQKLGDNAHTPNYIETRRGFGYILHRAQLVRSLTLRRNEAREPSDEQATESAASAPTAATPDWKLGPDPQAWSTLTRREWELFLLLGDEQATRLTNRALAHQLQMAESTLKKHLQHIYRKLEVANRASAALLAMQIKTYFSKERA